MYPNNYRRYAKMKKKIAIKNALFFIILFILGSAVAFFFIQKDLKANQPIDKPDDVDDNFYDIIDDTENLQIEDRDLQAVYIDLDRLDDNQYIDDIFTKVSQNELNALVITMKNEDGSFNYSSVLPYDNITLSEYDTTSIVNRAKEWGIPLIAEIFVYSDSNFASFYNETTFKNTDSLNWTDYNNNLWINPYSDEGFEYISSIIEELTLLGFSEIILSDFHFPVVGDFMSIVYDLEIPKADILSKRLQTLSENHKISLNLSQYAFTDNHIASGEDVEKLSENVFSVFVCITNDTTYNNFKYLNIENKVVLTSIEEYLVDNYIKNKE